MPIWPPSSKATRWSWWAPRCWPRAPLPKLTLVVILDMDAGFLSADFRGPEQAAQLLLQVAGRSGREGQGRVNLQSRHPDHHLLQLAASGDYPALASALLEERKMAGLHPFGHLALFRCEAMSMNKAMEFLQQLAPLPCRPTSTFSAQSLPPWKNAPGASAPSCCCNAPAAPLHQAISLLLEQAAPCPPPASAAGIWMWIRLICCDKAACCGPRGARCVSRAA